MVDNKGGVVTRGDERPRSAFVTFWMSLPGVLTGVAALVGAAAALVPLLGDGGDAPEASSGGSPLAPASAPASAPAGRGRDCGLEGVRPDRIKPVEAGTAGFDVVKALEPKSGDVGLRLTNDGQRIGNLRFAYFVENELFKVEAVMDARCRPVTDLENTSMGGDPRTLQNWNTLRLRLGGRLYTLTLGGGTTIGVSFVPFAP